MALQAKKLGHVAYVSTDHVYSLKSDDEGSVLEKESDFSMGPVRFERQCRDAAALTELSGFPIIVGIELSIRGFEEVVVIGRSAIKELYEIRSTEGFISVQNLANLRYHHKCIINLCHPSNAEKWIEEGGHKVIDGYEFIHSGTPMFPKRNQKLMPNEEHDPYERYDLIKLCNSDAHWSKSLYRCCNVIDAPITCEADLIDYIHNKGSVEFDIEPYRQEAKLEPEDIF
jgi:hypothetical protein